VRVLVVSPTSFSNMAGLYEYNVCRKLEQEGEDVFSLSLFGDNSAYCKNATVVPKCGPFSSRVSQELYSSFVHRVLIRFSPQIIHLNSALWSFLPLQVAFLNKFLMKHNGAMVLTTHSFYPDYQKRLEYAIIDSLRRFDPTALVYGARSLVLNYVDKVICLSNLEREFLLGRFGLNDEKLVVIPNAVDLNRFKVETYDFRSRFKIHAEFMLLYVGQVIAIKGLSYLLKALKAIKAEGFDCVLVVVTYNLREDIRSYATNLGINEQVIVIDYNKNNMTDLDLVSAYKSCDLFVLPSLAECLPTVLLEAMASEKAVVATRVGGVPEIVIDNYNGFLCEPSDSADLANKIIWLLESSNTRKRLGQNGFTLVKTQYNWDITIHRIIALYKSLTD